MKLLADRIANPLIALLAMFTTWAASCSWRPLYAAPHRFLVPALVIGAGAVLLGTALRGIRAPVLVTAVVQLLVAVLAVDVWFGHLLDQRHWWPTAGSLTSLYHLTVRGSEQLNAYTSPVPARYTAIAPFLTLCVIGLIVLVDLCACGLRRAPVAGLSILLTLTVPISVLDSRLALWVLVLTGALFITLLGVQHTRLMHGWGRETITSGADRRAASVSLVGGRIGALALAGAVVLPALVPVGQGVFNGHGNSAGNNGHQGLTLVNPMLDIRRDLISKTHTPMITVETDDPDPSYLRLTVLDRFTGSDWQASNRHLPAGNRADGALPVTPAMSAGDPGETTRWTLRIAPTFQTNWLPIPVPTRSLKVPGDWRFDANTLDVINTGKSTASEGLSYRAWAFKPAYDANQLNAAATPVGQAVTGETDLPANLPPVINRVTHQVTRGAKTEYQQAIALQDWFRTKGGFTYSTAPAPGSGMALLARFITDDKVGYCEQFATAMAVMGRTIGIPSRVVVGFLRPTGHASSPGEELFTTDDLHAWPEFYFAGSGWVRFEPTPAPRTGAAPVYTRQQLTPERENHPTRHLQPPPRAHSKPAVPAPHANNSTHHSSNWPAIGWLLGLLVLALLCSTPRLVRVRQRRSRLAPTPDASQLARDAWRELRATALDHGIGWADQRSARQALAFLRSRVTADPDLVRDLDLFRRFIERARYAQTFELTAAEADQMRDIVRTWSAAIHACVGPRAQRRARWWPQSLVSRTPPDPALVDKNVAARV